MPGGMTQAGWSPPPRQILTSSFETNSSGIHHLTMANLLKKPLKLALVQLATGPPHSVDSGFPANNLPQQAPTNPPTSPAPAPKSSKLLNMAQISSSSPNASIPPTVPNTSLPTPKRSYPLPPQRSNPPHITPFPTWPPKQAPIC